MTTATKSETKIIRGQKYRKGKSFVLVTTTKNGRVWGRVRTGTAGRYSHSAQEVDMTGYRPFESTAD